MSTENLNDNPLWQTEGPWPAFDLIRPEHVLPAVKAYIAEGKALLQSLSTIKSPTWSNLEDPLGHLGVKGQMIWGSTNHLHSVMNSPALRKEYEAAMPLMVSFGLEYAQNEQLYRLRKNLRESDKSLTKAQQRALDLALEDAKLSGIDLKPTDRESFNQCAQELTQFKNLYSNQVLDSVQNFKFEVYDPKDLHGTGSSARSLWSKAFKALYPQKSTDADQGPWLVGLDGPSYVEILSQCKSRPIREIFYKAYATRATEPGRDNTPLMAKILDLKQKQAHLLGFKTYADLSLSKKMAGKVSEAYRLIDELKEPSRKKAVKEFEELKAFAKNLGFAAELEPWDLAFYAERQRETLYGYTDEEVRPYFPLEKALEGLFKVIYELFGVRVGAKNPHPPTWHQDVRYYALYDENDKEFAGFYLDPYSRPETKRGGAWMDQCSDRVRLGAKVQMPIAYLNCNSHPPSDDKPALMTFREVETLFHEFGHGLQHMLTKMEYPGVSGINGVEWDAVELPSQFMEFWCYHDPIFDAMNGHYQSGEKLPQSLKDKIFAGRYFRIASMSLRQLQFAKVDLDIHHRTEPIDGPAMHDLYLKVGGQILVSPLYKGDKMLASFTHIFGGGYSAGYFSYKWAEVLSADAFEAFVEAGLDKPEAVRACGRRFKETVMALGGSLPQAEVYQQFRGRPASTKALIKPLLA